MHRRYMILYYYRAPEGNFGDDLNPWLWSSFLPDFFDTNRDRIFIGVGTLLNHRIPEAEKTIVFGSGVGCGVKPSITDTWDICFVRGPLSANVLHLDPNLSITDPAVLTSLIFPKSAEKKYRYSYIPHYRSACVGDWHYICRQIGLHYIDPRWHFLRVFREIQQTEVILTEAMHGSILADAFRVPWIPVKCYDQISDFKWADWQASVNLDVPFRRVSPIWTGQTGLGQRKALKEALKRTLLASGVWSDSWGNPMPARSNQRQLDKTCTELRTVVEKANPILSRQEILSQRIERLIEKIEYVKAVYGDRSSFSNQLEN